MAATTKKRPGRPKGQRTMPVRLNLSESEYAELAEAANRELRPLGQLARLLVMAGLRRRK